VWEAQQSVPACAVCNNKLIWLDNTVCGKRDACYQSPASSFIQYSRKFPGCQTVCQSLPLQPPVCSLPMSWLRIHCLKQNSRGYILNTSTLKCLSLCLTLGLTHFLVFYRSTLILGNTDTSLTSKYTFTRNYLVIMHHRYTWRGQVQLLKLYQTENESK